MHLLPARRLLGACAALLVVSGLAGCGEDDPGVTTISDPPDPVDPVLVHATAAGGEPATTLTRLPDDDALAAYVEQFRGGLPEKVTEAAERVDVRESQVLAAQVVAIGCDVPPGASVEGEAFVAEKVASPLKECLAPVTTVALAAIPQEG